MAIDVENIDCWDLTWFAYDKQGRLGVFFSNSTKSVLIKNILKTDNYEKCYDYFNGLGVNGSNPILSTELQDLPINNTNLEEFIFYVRKGLYVYDIDSLSQPSYSLVAKPSIPLSIYEIDTCIVNIIEKYESELLGIIRIDVI